MLTSKNIMDFVPQPGLTSSLHFLKNESFKDPLDPSNEQFTFDFMVQRLEEALAKLKPRDFYASKLSQLEAEITSLNDYHIMNVMRLHVDESDILRGNLEYLTKTRDRNIRKYYEEGGK
jgi:hypothetical protein